MNPEPSAKAGSDPQPHDRLPEGVLPEASREAPAGMSGPPGPLLRLIRDQRVAFLIVGGVNTLVGFGWFVLFELTVGRLLGGFGYLATLACAHVASVLCAFVLYRRFVFRVRGHVLRDLLRFEMVYLVSLGINFVALPLLVELAHLAPIVAQALIVVITTLVSWFGHRGFSFRRSAEEKKEQPS
ncbi:MAG: GtrA family protein [Protaetiibacter sp.]